MTTPPQYGLQVGGSACSQCGMVLRNPREYHPFAACILMEHYRNGDHVRAVLRAMRDYFAEGGSLDDISTRKPRKRA